MFRMFFLKIAILVPKLLNDSLMVLFLSVRRTEVSGNWHSSYFFFFLFPLILTVKSVALKMKPFMAA